MDQFLCGQMVKVMERRNNSKQIIAIGEQCDQANLPLCRIPPDEI